MSSYNDILSFENDYYNRKKEVYKPKPMTEGKRNLIQGCFKNTISNQQMIFR